MTGRVPLFVELCCGSAAVTLRLIGGPNARPPISYMGSKRGYAEAILNVLGLRSGQGADAVVLVEAGHWARVWQQLITPEGCRAVAAVIRGWVGEDARALWDRLRAEPVPESWGAREAGAWLWTGAVGHHGGGGYTGEFRALGPAQQEHMGPTTCAMYARTNGTDERGWPLAPQGCSRAEVAAKALSLDALSWPPVRVVEGDVAGVEPREVAAWCCLQDANVGSKEVTAAAVSWRTAGYASVSPAGLARGFTERLRADLLCGEVAAMSSLEWPPTVIAQADVAEVMPATLPEGTVVYCDPPYAKTTGYAHDLPREKVLEVAQRWADAGATVCVSEAEPLDLPGWHHVEITECRVGQKRTFSKQKREWLTLNREPAWRPGVQGELL